MPIMKIGLDERTHREFKVWCAGAGVSMSEQAAGLVAGFCEASGVRSSVKEVKSPSKPLIQAVVELVKKPVQREEPLFKVIEGKRFGSLEGGMLAPNTVLCMVCRQFCSGPGLWSKCGKDFVCGKCWGEA